MAEDEGRQAEFLFLRGQGTRGSAQDVLTGDDCPDTTVRADAVRNGNMHAGVDTAIFLSQNAQQGLAVAGPNDSQFFSHSSCSIVQSNCYRKDQQQSQLFKQMVNKKSLQISMFPAI